MDRHLERGIVELEREIVAALLGALEFALISSPSA
jgi:hypothetical protein